ncbi:Na+-transporting NADH:ubiquinone oxidoreductase subunit A [Dysgonomonas alginatilytica]|uniref:Na(+)-translocating NADH-quinone reductase subunit A n=1 Tax=Dysgonomonas alginatilytica TaxID=1605892 RepID=A0A2V3PWY2_9BACT|nr:Na(+)-translocating NADH-quinone reductase subunit A [Dysgonomonas alginatilytica]PXV65074.1 Na+-transporting NADH:ubiquinone oxidoreductase subunit A [Dysgonomonas alginatilytica]
MPKYIKIKKGLNIPIEGSAPEVFMGHIKPSILRIIPEDFPGLIPKVDVKVGDHVKAGTPLMHDKRNDQLVFVSPVSGIVVSITRGEKRKLLDITIEADKEIQQEVLDTALIEDNTADGIRTKLLKAGLWPFIKQRPYDIIADPNVSPRDIFITGFSSAPLAPSYDFIIENELQAFQKGIEALSELTSGTMYMGISPGTKSVALLDAKNVEICEFEGPHPAGNTGVQINAIKPVNKGETVWTITAPDVLIIGRFLLKGYVDFTRLVAYTGSETVKKGYYSVVIGSKLDRLFEANVTRGDNLRYISGNVLTGTQIDKEGSLRFYDSQITVIPEGDDKHDFVGWASVGLNKKYSAGGTYLSKLVSLLKPDKKYRLDARLMGGRRAIIMSNEYDKVFPMDILPEQLIKATITYNVDKMEQLGIYEVAPEDFALCEFVDTSKLEIQKEIREGLLKLKKEME